MNIFISNEYNKKIIITTQTDRCVFDSCFAHICNHRVSFGHRSFTIGKFVKKTMCNISFSYLD